MSDSSKPSSFADEMLANGLGLLAFLFLLFFLCICWLAICGVVELFPPVGEGSVKDESGLARLQMKCETTFGRGAGATFRIERRAGGNIRVFLEKEAFESVPYPDRPRVIADVAGEWCQGINKLFLPSVSFKDIRNGDALGSKNCVLPKIF
jgi:hypothetical protein